MYFYNKYKANSNFLLKIVAFVGSLHNCENCKNHAYMGHVQNPPPFKIHPIEINPI